MSDLLTEREIPAGFHPTADGLIVPDAVARTKETWTRDEARLVDRVLKLMRGRDLAVVLKCNTARCKGAEVTVHRDEPGDGYTWRCSCTDRVFHRHL